MSEIDNLEALSNADLRKKCLENGLPNVPITDSSRNLLIKKLRASLSGAPASSPKKTPRRETIHVSKVKEVAESKEETKVEPERRTPSRGAGRRTIAGTPTLESQKASEITVTESIGPAPIGTRRRSSARELEIPSSQKENKTIKSFKPVIIIESDEEENDLLLAAEQAEQKSKATPTIVQNEPNIGRARSSRSVSLSKTGVVTTSYNQGVKPLPEVPEVPTRNLLTENISRDIYQPSISTNSNRYSLHSNFVQTSAGANKLATGLQSRYSTNTVGGGLYSSMVIPLYNEQSDEDTEQQDYETPFLSSFARNLERIKTDGVAMGKSSIDLQSPRLTHRSKRFEITGRRPANDSVTESFRQFLIALNRKYNLRLYLVLATVFLVLAFLYVVMYQ